jgi:hypothetical protein
LTRASIILRKAFFEDGWIAGSSPAMTDCWTITCQSEHGMGNFVPVAGWQPAHGFERFVQQFGRGDNMPSAGPEWKGFVDMCL